jgi:hypothetical protein
MLTADVLTEEKQDEQALSVLARVPADDPLAPLAALRRAAVLDKLDRPDEAVACCGAWPTPTRTCRSPRRTSATSCAGATASRKRPRLRPSPRARAQPGVRDWPLFYSRAIARERAGDWPRAEPTSCARWSSRPTSPTC